MCIEKKWTWTSKLLHCLHPNKRYIHGHFKQTQKTVSNGSFSRFQRLSRLMWNRSEWRNNMSAYGQLEMNVHVQFNWPLSAARNWRWHASETSPYGQFNSSLHSFKTYMDFRFADSMLCQAGGCDTGTGAGFSCVVKWFRNGICSILALVFATN